MNRWIPTIAAIVLAAIFAVPATRHWRERPPAPPPAPQPLRSAWIAPDDIAVGSGGDYAFGLSLAADGRKLVYPAAKAGVVSLWLHDLRNGETRALPGTSDAALPFFSPDAKSVGFFARGRLLVLDLESGAASDLTDVAAPRGGTSNAAGDVIFATANGPLMLRSASGAVTSFTTLDAAQGDTAHAWPSFLSDGRHVIFLVSSAQASRAGIWITSLDEPGKQRRLLASETQAIVVDRTLLYLRDQVLVAQPIDQESGALVGRGEAVGSHAGRGPLGQLFAAASADVLIYGAPGSTLRELKWFARDGTPAGASSEPVDAWDLRIAPEGGRIAVTQVDRQLRTLDVFIRNGTQPSPARLSLSTDADESAVWSPDGLRVAWAGQRRKVMIRGAGAVLPEQTVATFDPPLQVWDWSRDGKSLLIGRRNADTGEDLWLLPPHEGAAAQPYTAAPFDQTFGVFSPDGRSIAYASNESGQFDIYLDSFPKPGSRVRVTTAGGTEPRWSAAGRELYFRRGSEIHAVALAGLEVRSTTRLFDAGATIRAYDVSRDGRFLLNLPAAGHAPGAATLVSHWQ